MIDIDKVDGREIGFKKVNPKIVVVIPAYNEERFIGSTVAKTLKFADTVVVIDDGSTDDTANIAEAVGALVVRQPQNMGKGVALTTGFRHVRSLTPDVVVTIDADGQHEPAQLLQVISPVIQGQADIVVGSRYLQKNSKVPTHRIWGHHIFNFITNRMSGVSVTDSQSGFRAFSPQAVEAIASMSFLSNGFSVESEMQFLARDQGLKVVEVPITIHYHDKAKRPVVKHGMMVLEGLLRLAGQYRPLLFFGLPGLMMLLSSFLGWGLIIEIYRTSQSLAVGYAMICVVLSVLGSVSLSTGVTLHSIRGFLLDLWYGSEHSHGKSKPRKQKA